MLLKNVRVEVVYEENPVPADEEVSAIIRFRHFGVPKPVTSIAESDNESVDQSSITQTEASTNGTSTSNGNSEPQEPEGGWFGRRISMQLTNSARALFMDDEVQKKPDWRNQPVNLMFGFAQLSGVMTYNPELIDHAQFNEIRKKAAVSGKIGGLDGFEMSKNDQEGLLSRITGGIGGMLNSEVNDLHVDDKQKKKKKTDNIDNVVPFFSTPKTLLFSEQTLKDGETPVFYLKCKLPKGIPPTFIGKAVQIKYHLIVGASLDDKLPKPISLTFPLNVSPHFDQKGYQPIAAIDNFILLSPQSIVSESVISKNGSTSARRASFRTIKNTALTQPKLSQSTKKDKFLDKLRQMTNGTTEEEITIDDFKSTKVKENISVYTEALNNKGELSQDEPKIVMTDGYTMEKQVMKLQTQYVISRDGKSITTLSFSKPLYKIGESIKLSLNFESSEIRSTGVLISLENLELIRDTFAVNPEEKSSPPITTHYKESFSVFSHTLTPVEIPIPLSASSQFKTNVFESRWCINIKFILTEETLNQTLHEDTTGRLITAKESLGGLEFNCRLPVTILPSDKVFGGITI